MRRLAPILALALCACTSAEQKATDEALAAVRAAMVDPASAQFRGVWRNEVTGAVCGEVNGKNRMGGMNGFTSFYHVNGGTFMIEPGMSDKEQAGFLRGMNSICGEGPPAS